MLSDSHVARGVLWGEQVVEVAVVDVLLLPVSARVLCPLVEAGQSFGKGEVRVWIFVEEGGLFEILDYNRTVDCHRLQFRPLPQNLGLSLRDLLLQLQSSLVNLIHMLFPFRNLIGSASGEELVELLLLSS